MITKPFESILYFTKEELWELYKQIEADRDLLLKQIVAHGGNELLHIIMNTNVPEGTQVEDFGE